MVVVVGCAGADDVFTGFTLFILSGQFTTCFGHAMTLYLR